MKYLIILILPVAIWYYLNQEHNIEYIYIQQFEGHEFSCNLTLDDGSVIKDTRCFFKYKSDSFSMDRYEQSDYYKNHRKNDPLHHIPNFRRRHDVWYDYDDKYDFITLALYDYGVAVIRRIDDDYVKMTYTAWDENRKYQVKSIEFYDIKDHLYRLHPDKLEKIFLPTREHMYWSITFMLDHNLGYDKKDPISKLYYWWITDVLMHELKIYEANCYVYENNNIWHDEYSDRPLLAIFNSYQKCLIERIRQVISEIIPRLNGFNFIEENR